MAVRWYSRRYCVQMDLQGKGDLEGLIEPRRLEASVAYRIKGCFANAGIITVFGTWMYATRDLRPHCRSIHRIVSCRPSEIDRASASNMVMLGNLRPELGFEVPISWRHIAVTWPLSPLPRLEPEFRLVFVDWNGTSASKGG